MVPLTWINSSIFHGIGNGLTFTLLFVSACFKIKPNRGHYNNELLRLVFARKIAN